MTHKTIGVALLVMTLAGSTMGQTNIPEKKLVVQQGPAVTIPLSTGTAISFGPSGSSTDHSVAGKVRREPHGRNVKAELKYGNAREPGKYGCTIDVHRAAAHGSDADAAQHSRY